MVHKPIFFDPTGRRRARISVVGWVLAIFSTLVGIGFMASILAVDHKGALPLTSRLTAIHTPDLERTARDPSLLRAAAKLAVEERAKRIELARQLRASRHALPSRMLSPILKPQSQRPLSMAFYATWDDQSFSSLKRALPKLDWVIPSWLTLDGPNLDFKTALDKKALNYIRRTKPSTAILPMLQNASKATWDGPGLAKLLADKTRRDALVDKVVDFVARNKLQGVTLDFEEVPHSAYRDLGIFLNNLSAAFAGHDWIIVQAAPFDDDSWPFAEYGDIVDYTMLMAYDEHDDTGEAGSIAGQSWYEENLDKRMRVLSPDSTIVAVGNYAYDWMHGNRADDLSFQDAVIAARDSKSNISFDAATNNPHLSYLDEDGTRHDVWFLDAVTAFNQIHAADVFRPAGYALWRLGTEDSSIWNVMNRNYDAPAPETLRTIRANSEVDFEGMGEVIHIESQPSEGARTLEIDPQTGDIDDEHYTSLPSGYVIRQSGIVPHKVALSFDDGPDPAWTPQILDILKEKHVPATFFVIGENAEAHPGLIKRILDEGHELGNHTFSHPNLEDTPPALVKLELNATQRLIEALTGRSMRMFRPPYLGDAEPVKESELVPVEIAQDLGYVTIGVHVDPADWELPPISMMMKRIMAAVNSNNPELKGDIVLLHDSGGDRSGTVAALPLMIDRLRAEGYTFVPVSELAGMTRDQAMPPLAPTISLMADRLVFLTLSALGTALYYAFIGAIVLGVGRLFVLCGLSLVNRIRHMRREPPPPSKGGIPVSVLIPAYNEEKVIATTVERILGCDYADLQVIVIDDGSQDHTNIVLRSRFGSDPRVQIFTIPNGGKANALNAGLAHATGEVVVALDADTQFDHDTISRLVRWFANPGIGAVAGNAKVGNRINTITRWQALEYIVAQNLERRALAALGTFTVVPGAVGAWRREALVKLGGFPNDTLAEDQDLTIGMQKQGYKVMFDGSAIAWTEAPSTVRGLAKQRFRWAYGTLQCLWKYRDITFNPRYGALGMVALPQVWMFQILLTALAPIADLTLIWQLITQWIAYQQHGAEFSNSNLKIVGIYYCVFMVVDLAAAVFGFAMERREKWSLLWWLMLQRFGYRQLMYYVVLRSITSALRGAFVGWGKLERTGTVTARTA